MDVTQTSNHLAPIRTLVVDDDAFMLKIMERIFKCSGH